MITVYTKPGCPACVGTMRYLERHGLAYEIVNIDQDCAAREFVLNELRFTSLPVVDPGDGTEAWSGLRIDKLNALKTVTDDNDSAVISE